MIIVPLYLAFSLLTPTTPASDQCPPPPASTAAEGKPYFEFQVETPAKFINDDAMVLVPDPKNRATKPYPPDFALAQFIVDSAGVPDASSLKMLVKPDALAEDDVRDAVKSWRFSPAVLNGCRVPQLVMTPLRWKK